MSNFEVDLKNYLELGTMREGKAELCRYVTYNTRQGKAKLHIFELNPVFHHLHSNGPRQLCALAHPGCTRAAGTS